MKTKQARAHDNIQCISVSGAGDTVHVTRGELPRRDSNREPVA